MDNEELSLISILIQERLLADWDKCDQLGMGSEYERITDECYTLRNIAQKLKLDIPDEIRARY